MSSGRVIRALIAARSVFTGDTPSRSAPRRVHAARVVSTELAYSTASGVRAARRHRALEQRPQAELVGVRHLLADSRGRRRRCIVSCLTHAPSANAKKSWQAFTLVSM